MHLDPTGTGALARVASALLRAVVAVAPGVVESVEFEPPRNAQFGDFASNVAFTLARALRRKPQEIAQDLAAAVLADPEAAPRLAEAAAAGGFINIRMVPGFWQSVVARVLRDGRGLRARGTARRARLARVW